MNSYVVYEQNGKIYDCKMAETKIGGDIKDKKCIIVQLIKKKNEDAYFLFFRWGRFGQFGQTSLKAYQNYLQSAILAYEYKIHEKFERDYQGENDQEALSKDVQLKVYNKERSFKQNQLHYGVKKLIRWIFDFNTINDQMNNIGYDAIKLPLRKLVASKIKEGFNGLKQIQDELDKESPNQVEFLKLTYDFYSQIPHYFKQNKVPLINKNKKVQSRYAGNHLIYLNNESKNDSDEIAEIYKKLNIDIQYLEHNSEKVKLIKTLIQNTQGYSCNLEVEHVFELTKEQDDKRFKKDLGNRMLLWYGSPSNNFAAPLEAPVTAYRFGKGVYLTDVLEKAVSYCYTDYKSESLFILLCDVALGNPVIKFDYDCYASNLPKDNHSTWGKARCYPPEKSYVEMPGLPNVKVPIGKPEPSDFQDISRLKYNEFIVYDVAQVRLKYLLNLKWKN